MTTLITVDGVDASANSIGFAPPVSSGLVGWFHLGGTAAESVRNRAYGGAAGVSVGPPTFSAGYASSTGNTQRISTTLHDTAAITLLVVAKSNAAFNSITTRPTIIGTYASEAGGIAGAAIQVLSTPSVAPAATVAITASRDSAGLPIQTPASVAVANFSNWTFLAGVVQSGAVADGRKIYDKTNGTSGVATPATARLPNVASFITLMNMTSLVQGAVDVAWGAIYNRALTEAEIDKIKPFVAKRLLDKYGIVC